MKMFLVCGMPGSGKSTFAEAFAKENYLEYICIDDFYTKVNGNSHDRSHKFEVWIKFFEAIHKAYLEGRSVVVETMALEAYNRREIISWFPEFDEHYLIFIECDYFHCLENVQKRDRKISEEGMKKLYERFEYPTDEEFKKWDAAIEIGNVNNKFYYRPYSFYKEYNFPKRMLNGVIEN